MSKTLEDSSVAVNDANRPGLSSSSSFHVESNSVNVSSNASSPNVQDKDKRKHHSRKEKSSKVSKKQAMGDIASSDDPTKSTTESTASRTVNDNASGQKQSKVFTKSNEPKKGHGIRRFDENRRRRGTTYGNHRRRGTTSFGSRSTTYISRNYSHPHATTAYNSNNSRLPSTSHAGQRIGADSAASIDNAENINKHRANTESLKNTDSRADAISRRSKVTRTFHNGALRASRTLHTNVVTRSRRHTIASEVTFQTVTKYTISSERALYGSGADGVGDSICGSVSYSTMNTLLYQKPGKLPIIYVAPAGTISILLNKGITVEVAIDRAVRVLCHDKFSAVCNSDGIGSCILHKKGRIFQQDEKVFCNFGPSFNINDKAVVFGTQGVLFTMSHLAEAYLVSSKIVKGALSVSLGRLQFPSLDYDFTVRMFFTESQNGNEFIEFCNDIVRGARYGRRNDGSLTLTINGVFIKQNEHGDVDVSCRPKHISCSPSDGFIRIRTNIVDMAVQDDEKAFVKRGLKRVHVSRSGMVVSDGNCVTSMDHFGHIVSST
ncbi:unnamed protein product [Litomosoides sigmodontis]|uniref:Uncharacterized protein n=1 Tax=Litomosoides sigmodontis TaxID=42156 RepID=A0A3P6TAR4_LITSI|nr:unnamed protein product [Litomosoides sigmodontis]